MMPFDHVKSQTSESRENENSFCVFALLRFCSIKFLGSYGLACMLLLGLFVLTLLGTLEQGNLGLYQARQKYFDSIFVYIGGVPVFPGGYTLMSLLAINILFGALMRRTSFGMYLVHGGVILLLAGGMITHHFADEGRLILNPGDPPASVFESNRHWEFVLTDAGRPDRDIEYIVDEKDFPERNNRREFRSPAWPFDLVLSEYMRNAEPRVNMENPPKPNVLANLPEEKENELNAPGLRVTIAEKTSGSRDGQVWGLERGPWVFESGGGKWLAHLRRRQFPLPFSLVLKRFVHENHPGTQIPAVYQSDLVLRDGISSTPVSIKMNEPLRHRGYTFFQSSYYEESPGRTASVLAVVRNPLERLPLWSTVLITLGLTIHFWQRLSRNLPRARTAASATLVFLTYILPSTHARAADADALFTPRNVSHFGAIPIQSEGRVKPIATFARFKLIQFSGRSTLGGESATRWLMRTVFSPGSTAEDKIFLIENPKLMQALGLSDDSPRARFSFVDLFPQRLELEEQARAAAAVSEQQRGLLQNQTLNLYDNVLEFQALTRSLNVYGQDVEHEIKALAIVQPEANDDTEWLTPGEADDFGVSTKYLDRIDSLTLAMDDPAQFSARLESFRRDSTAAANARGEGRRLGLEVFYYKADFFGRGLVLFILGFILIALSWLAPRKKLAWRGGVALTSLAIVLVGIGIVVRCAIRGRPPVTNLYETTLFVPAVAAAIALGAEWFDRRRIAAGLGALLGAIGLFIANRYELRDGADTMGSLVAVLNSNFWLATHVTTISIGYSAGLLAGALAHIYIVGLLMRGRVGAEFSSKLSSMIYGVICFALLFSLLGTVLGGIWANESWGRFWGWDPKENGALLIVLWCVAIVHARLGGYIREFGIAASAVGLAMVVVFSWWGVNLLGVGLHSYGFTSGILGWLVGYWIFELGVIVVGAVARGYNPMHSAVSDQKCNQKCKRVHDRGCL